MPEAARRVEFDRGRNLRSGARGPGGDARTTRSGGTGRKQEMGEDDIGTSPLRRRPRLPGEACILGGRSAAPADRGDLDFVSESLELAGQRHQEAAEVRVLGARPHLGYEQDPHAARVSTAGPM